VQVVIPQLMPAGDDVTTPLAPTPVTATVSVAVRRVNCAVTEAAAVIGTVHVVVPVQAPPQPAKTEPEAAVAVNVTLVPSA
jgi:hypothetical protein